LPADITEDTYIFPLVKATYIVPFVIACGAAGMIFLFCWAAAAVVLGFVFLFMIPLSTAVILALDIPGWLNKWKLFRQESGHADERELTEAEPGSPQDISVILGSQVVMVCEIKPGPWDYLTPSERQAAADSFRAALAETNQSGVMTQVVLENYHETRNIPGPVSTCPGTLAMLEARNSHWNGMERFQAYYHVVFWGKRGSPGESEYQLYFPGPGKHFKLDGISA